MLGQVELLAIFSFLGRIIGYKEAGTPDFYK
jgi:hypothetical protein